MHRSQRKRTRSPPDHWIHEIKYDSYQIMVREQDRVCLIGRGGHDWARHFLMIVESALRLRQDRFMIDGEGGCLVLRRLRFLSSLIQCVGLG